MVVEQKQGKGSAKKSKDDPKTRIRAKAFSRWFARYRKDVMVMSQAEFGNYMQQFIIYLLKLEGTNLTSKDKASAQERLRGELTEMARGFEVEFRYSDSKINEAWTKLFLLFCMTGRIDSNYNLFDYLDTNDDSKLPKNAWVRKEIPLILVNKAPSAQSSQKEVRASESKTSTKNTRMELSETATISDLLAKYVREQMTERGITQSSVLRSLTDQMSESGEWFGVIELELILNKISETSYIGQVRSIVKCLAELKALTKEDGSPYSVAELLATPLGFEPIKEDGRFLRLK